MLQVATRSATRSETELGFRVRGVRYTQTQMLIKFIIA